MSARGLGLLLAIGALLIAGCGEGGNSTDVTAPGAGITRQISGRWTGKLHQKGVQPFVIGVDIGAGGNGEVAYTGIECAGHWTLDRVEPSAPPRYLFNEEITEGAGGNCKGTGRVSLAPIQENEPNEPAYVQLNYQFTGGGVISRGLLHRTDAGALAPVFEGAGIKPPDYEPTG